MSTHAEAHDHGHGGQGGDHVPHVLPLKTYLATWGTLLVLTVITVGASYLDLGKAVNVAVALGIATIKALVVAAVFMHLRYDHKFHSVILFSAFLFLAIFIGLTMFDTETRGSAETIENARPTDSTKPFAPKTASTTTPAAIAVPNDPEPAAPAAPPPTAAPAPTPAEAPTAAPSAAPTAAPAGN